MSKTVRLDGTGRVDGHDDVDAFKRDPEGEISLDRRKDHEKRALYEWIHEAWSAGLKSPSLLGAALDPPLTGSRITQILEDLGLHGPRMTITDKRFPPHLVEKLAVINASRRRARNGDHE